MVMLALLATAAVVCLLLYLIGTARRPPNFPPGPTFVPLLGNAIELRRDALALGGQHLAFEAWSRRYNSNVLGLKLGGELVVVVLSPRLVHEVHVGEVFEGRPDNFFLRLRTMGTRLGITCTDGRLWREQRNFAMRQLRHAGYGRTTMAAHIAAEAAALVRLVGAEGGRALWPGRLLAPSVINVLWRLAAGARISHDDRQLRRLLELLGRRAKAFDVSGGLLTQFPWLRFVAPHRTGYHLIRQLNAELNTFLMDTIGEHLERANDHQRPPPDDTDLIYAYLHQMRQLGVDISSSNTTKVNTGVTNKVTTDTTTTPTPPTTFTITQLMMVILDFFIAGSQTTSNTLDLALMMLALRPDIQDRVFDEVAANDGGGGGGGGRGPYLDAFVMEVQRYFHITPVTGPRRALWDTTLGGYNIPKGTTILIGLFSVLMDANHWTDPAVFRPERFLADDGRTIIKDDHFIPFGQGRRRCPGDILARACLLAFVSALVARFRIEYDGERPPNVAQLHGGITLSAPPYQVKFIERKQQQQQC